MSYLSQLFRKQITFKQFAEKAASWFGNEVQTNPQAATALSDLKQKASNLLAYADTEASAHMDEFVATVEAATDKLLLGLTGPAGLVAVPLVNTAISQVIGVGKGVLDAAEARAKSVLQLPAPTSNVPH